MTKEEGKHATREKKEVAIPGEIIATGDVLPGDWTIKEGDNIIATRYGIVDKTSRIVKIIPISGVYTPRRGNVVIAKVTDLTMRGWIMDIQAPYQAFLQLKECPMYVNEYEMESVYGIGDLVVTKIVSIRRRDIDLTTKGRGLDKIKDGMVIEINAQRVPRVIGREGSMINQIKITSGCDITIGQNGIIWIRGKTTEDELFAKKAIEFVVENTISEGLTEKVEAWMKENKPKASKKEEKAKEEKAKQKEEKAEERAKEKEEKTEKSEEEDAEDEEELAEEVE